MALFQAIIEIQRDGRFVEQRRLTDQPMTIGRAVDNELILSDPTVSREHARIEPQANGYVMVDITGRQRTLINGQPIERQELTSGDEITIGPFTLLYRTDAPVADETHDVLLSETLLTLSPVGSSLYERVCAHAAEGRLSPSESRLWALKDKLKQCKSEEQAVSLLLSQAMELIPADRGQVIFSGQDDGEVVAASLPPEGADDLPLSATVIRQVLATGQALACIDVGRDRRFRAVESLAQMGALGVLAAPLLAAGRVAGAICLVREKVADRFGEDDLHTLCAITQLGAEAIESAIARAAGGASAIQLRRQADLPYPLVYRSQVMQRITRQVLRVAATDATVLIYGPSGSGKELIAAAIHYGSLRSAGPFIKVNCAAIPETLIESELFGHEKGAFTDARATRKGRFELADGGTLFLDEIGDMPLAVQTRLLRAIETRQIERVGGSAPITVQVRLIAATHQNLPDMVRQGRFREDLWYRLEVVRIDIPSLKDRGEDVPLLFRIFADSFAASMQTQPVRLSDQAVQVLTAYDWPGNVRQLRNLAERLTIFDAGQVMSADMIKRMLGPETAEPAGPLETGPFGFSEHARSGPIRPLADARADFEREYVRRALIETEGNITRAAELLGLARENLSRKIKQLRIEIP